MTAAVLRTSCFALLMALLSCQGRSGVSDNDTVAIDPDKSVVCFMYHRFDDSKFPSTSTSTNDFEAHLRYLKENGFTVLSFSAAMEYLRSDTPAKKVAVITIDDGYKSFYERGLPLLRKYEMPATLFINTGTVAASDYMDWDQLKMAMESGVEIGNHTHSHSYFMNEEAPARYETFERDIKKSVLIISEKLGITPEVFAYPFGEFDTGMKQVVKDTGFKYAAAQHSGVVHSGTDVYQVPRFPMSGAYAELAQFAEKASMLPLKVVGQRPDDTTLPSGDLRPLLRLIIENEGLQTNRMQCFVQGAECALTIIEENSNEITITVRATRALSRRRTLYTLTAPDTAGAWHWYSHLWINSEVRD